MDDNTGINEYDFSDTSWCLNTIHPKAGQEISLYNPEITDQYGDTVEMYINKRDVLVLAKHFGLMTLEYRKKFPILQNGEKVYIDWDCLNEDWAQVVHGQTLQQLSERGGLSIEEVYLNVNRKPASCIKEVSESSAICLVNQIRVK